VRRLVERRVAHIQKLRAFLLKTQRCVDRERLQRLFEHALECRPLLGVQNGIIGEIGGCIGLVCDHHADKLPLGHRLQGVVHPSLDPDGRKTL